MSYKKNSNHNSTSKERVIVYMGTGGMWSYSIGFTEYIRQNFDMQNCKFSAISGGTMAAALACQPTDKIYGHDWHYETMIKGMKEIQNDYTYQRLYTTLGKNCKNNKFNDHKWHTRCYNRLYIPQWSVVSKSEIITAEWNTTSDLVDCILAACHIPYVMDGRYSADYNNDSFIDIGLGKYHHYNPNPAAPFFYIGPRNQIRKFPLTWQTIWKQPNHMQYLYDQGFNDAKKCHSLLQGFFFHGYDLFLGEGDIESRYKLESRWINSPLHSSLIDMAGVYSF